MALVCSHRWMRIYAVCRSPYGRLRRHRLPACRPMANQSRSRMQAHTWLELLPATTWRQSRWTSPSIGTWRLLREPGGLLAMLRPPRCAHLTPRGGCVLYCGAQHVAGVCTALERRAVRFPSLTWRGHHPRARPQATGAGHRCRPAAGIDGSARACGRGRLCGRHRGCGGGRRG